MASNKKTYPFKQNGYIYSKGTAKGFLRMQRQGIPRPVFAVEDRMNKILKKYYSRLARQIIADFKSKAKAVGINLRDPMLTKDGDEEDESLNSLLQFFEDMKNQEEEAKKAQEEAQLKSQVQNIQYDLISQWDQENNQPINEEQATEELQKVLEQDQDSYLSRLFTDGKSLAAKIENFSIDKQQLYNNNMEQLRKLYLDNTMERIKYEEVYLKRIFINRLNDYVTGKTDKLQIDDVVKDLYDSSEHMARFFARDQLSRFNKATTLATFNSAGVTKVKWVTTHDIRVRETHKALDGRIFGINNLPEEIHDYNCRCGLVPVEWAD